MFSIPSFSNMNYILNPPGSNLLGTSRRQFEEVKNLIDSGTHEMLLQPDWDIVMRCCDLVKLIHIQEVIHEVVLYIRKKMNSKTPMKAFLGLTILEALVKNCGPKMYLEINDKSFLEDMAKVVKKYSGLAATSGDCRDVAELSTDIIQAWGEGFLPLSRQYPNISRTYHDLRREGIQFKPQHDPLRVPNFAEASRVGSNRPLPTAAAVVGGFGGGGGMGGSGYVGGGGGEDYIDNDLAAALQASLRTSGQRSASIRPIPASLAPRQPIPDLIASVNTSCQMLKDLISNLTNPREAQNNEFAEDIVAQLRQTLQQLNEQAETALETNPEHVDSLFAACDQGNNTISIFNDVKTGKCTISKATSLLSANRSSTSPVALAPPSSQSTTVNLLDDIFSSPLPAANSTPAVQPPKASSDFDFFNAPSFGSDFTTPAHAPAPVAAPVADHHLRNRVSSLPLPPPPGDHLRGRVSSVPVGTSSGYPATDPSAAGAFNPFDQSSTESHSAAAEDPFGAFQQNGNVTGGSAPASALGAGPGLSFFPNSTSVQAAQAPAPSALSTSPQVSNHILSLFDQPAAAAAPGTVYMSSPGFQSAPMYPPLGAQVAPPTQYAQANLTPFAPVGQFQQTQATPQAAYFQSMPGVVPYQQSALPPQSPSAFPPAAPSFQATAAVDTRGRSASSNPFDDL